MRRKTTQQLIGFTAFLLVATLLTAVIWNSLQRPVKTTTAKYHAMFTDASGVRAGDDVRVAGVRVGRVDAVSLDGDLARVTFSVDSAHPAHAETEVAIRYQNLIGQRYLSLDTPDAAVATEPLATGAVIGPDRTEPSFDVSALLNGFEPLFSVLRPEQVNSLSQSIIDALQGDEASLSALIAQTAVLAEDFAARDEVLGSLIVNLSDIVSTLAEREGEITTVIENTATLVSGLSARSAELSDSVATVGAMSGPLADLISDVGDDLGPTVVNFSSVADMLNSDSDRLRDSAEYLPVFLASFARITQNGSYINLYVCNLDISLGGVLFPPGVFTQVGGNRHTEVCR